MHLTQEQKHALGVALNEASFLGVEVDTGRRLAAVTFSVLTLPRTGAASSDRRVQFLLAGVSRVSAKLRDGIAPDKKGEVVGLELSDLLKTVEGFGGQPIYGWEFIDVHDTILERWGGEVSLDWRSNDQEYSHSLHLFQEGGTRDLDLCVWFGDLQIRMPDGQPLSLDEFCEGGRRWWDALYAGDQRTEGFGIVPAKRDDA